MALGTNKLFLIGVILSVVLLTQLVEAAPIILSSFTHCDIGGPWKWRTQNSFCPAETTQQAGSCPIGSTEFKVNNVVIGCYYSAKTPICKAAITGYVIPDQDECCFYTCKPNPLKIKIIDISNPNVKIEQGLTEKILIKYETSRYPIEVRVELKSQNNLVDVFGPNTVESSLAGFPIEYLVPKKAKEGKYEVFLDIKDQYDGTFYEKIADVEITPARDTTPPASVRNLRAISAFETNITWTWENPTDIDFDHANLFINEIKVAESKLSSYTARNLIPNTTYKLGIQTLDSSGNVNLNTVINITKTLPIPKQNDTSKKNIFLEIESPANTTYNTNNILIRLKTANSSTPYYVIDNMPSTSYLNPVTVFLQEGSHKLTAFAPNGTEVVTKQVIFNINLTSARDTTPPASVRNLHLVAKSNESISWAWENPTDIDFDQAIIYINGINVRNDSLSTFVASNLQSNSFYTIRINTKDKVGNVNLVDITDDQMTNSNPPTTQKKNKGGNSDDDGTTVFVDDQDIIFKPVNKIANRNNSQDTILINAENKSLKKSGISIWIIILALDIILALVLLAFLIINQNKK